MNRATSPDRYQRIDPRTMTNAQMIEIIKRRSADAVRRSREAEQKMIAADRTVQEMIRIVDTWLENSK